MIDWCMQYEMTVCNTLFKKRDVHKYTWVRYVRGEIVESALMDYMCISGKYKAAFRLGLDRTENACRMSPDSVSGIRPGTV